MGSNPPRSRRPRMHFELLRKKVGSDSGLDALAKSQTISQGLLCHASGRGDIFGSMIDPLRNQKHLISPRGVLPLVLAPNRF